MMPFDTLRRFFAADFIKMINAAADAAAVFATLPLSLMRRYADIAMLIIFAACFRHAARTLSLCYAIRLFSMPRCRRRQAGLFAPCCL